MSWLEIKNIIILKCHPLLPYATTANHSWSDCDLWQRVDFKQQLAMTGSVVGPRSYKALSKAKLPPKKSHDQCLLVSDPLQLSDSWWSHYIRECSAHQWESPKTAMCAAGIGQQKGPNSFLRWCLTTHCIINTSKVERIGMWSFASSAIFTWPLSNWAPLLQVSQQFFAGKTLPQPAGCTECIPQFIKSWSMIFMLQE